MVKVSALPKASSKCGSSTVSQMAWRHCTVMRSVASRSESSRGCARMPFHTSEGRLKGSVARVRSEMPMRRPTNSNICMASGDVRLGLGRNLSVLVLTWCTPLGHSTKRSKSGLCRSSTISLTASRYTPPASIPSSLAKCTEKRRPPGSVRRSCSGERSLSWWNACAKTHCEVAGSRSPRSALRSLRLWSRVSEMFLPKDAVLLRASSRRAILRSCRMQCPSTRRR
mmetsp:Transcript_9192/g.31347  ORF Transcript_9192/g.31347 Transcript_9192/m.31347 type:complete len:226 (+) Transcript_9192:1682-2359(+)